MSALIQNLGKCAVGPCRSGIGSRGPLDYYWSQPITPEHRMCVPTADVWARTHSSPAWWCPLTKSVQFQYVQASNEFACRENPRLVMSSHKISTIPICTGVKWVCLSWEPYHMAALSARSCVKKRPVCWVSCPVSRGCPPLLADWCTNGPWPKSGERSGVPDRFSNTLPPGNQRPCPILDDCVLESGCEAPNCALPEANMLQMIPYFTKWRAPAHAWCCLSLPPPSILLCPLFEFFSIFLFHVFIFFGFTYSDNKVFYLALAFSLHRKQQLSQIILTSGEIIETWYVALTFGSYVY